MSADANWTPAMARQDISNQVAEANDAWNDEISSHRHDDWADIYDDRAPTRQEADAQMFEDWLYDRNHGRHTA